MLKNKLAVKFTKSIIERKTIMKKLKKITALVLAVLFLVSIQSSAFAKVVDDEVSPCWIISCSSGGKHQMSPRHGGHLYSGVPGDAGIDYGWGYLSQCTLCKEVIWSTYQPYSTNKLGNYYVSPYIRETLPAYGSPVYMDGGTVEYFGGNVLTDSYWQGYDFLPV